MSDPGETTGAEWSFSYEGALHEAFPKLHNAQSEWLSELESLTDLDRVSVELIRLACNTGARNSPGVVRHAQLARELGASWNQIVEAIVLTQPSFGVGPAAEALPFARQGYEQAAPPETD